MRKVLLAIGLIFLSLAAFIILESIFNANDQEESILLTENTSLFVVEGEYSPDLENKFINFIINNKSPEVVLWFNSPGGRIDSLLGILNAQKFSKAKFICIAENAYSAAFYHFMLCDERYILPKGSLLTHRVSIGGIGGNLDQIHYTLDYIESVEKYLMKKAANNLYISYDELMQISKQNRVMSPTEAEEIGAATIIEKISCSKNLIENYVEKVFELDILGFIIPIRYIDSACPLVHNPKPLE